MQHPLRTVDEDAIALDDGTAPRSVIVAIEVFVCGLVAEGPKHSTGLALQADQLRLIPLAVKMQQASLADRRHAVACSEWSLPELFGTCCGPVGQNAAFRRFTVSRGPQKTWPVRAQFSSAEILYRHFPWFVAIGAVRFQPAIAIRGLVSCRCCVPSA